jgi:dienelactone hydrolase
MPAQYLTQRRAGAQGALLYLGAVPTSEFGSPWPAGVPVQMHMKEDDPWANEDMPAAKALMEEADDAELFVYPGSGHLFAGPSHEDYDEPAARLLMERTLAFLERVG